MVAGSPGGGETQREHYCLSGKIGFEVIADLTRPIVLDVNLRSRRTGPRLPDPEACPRCGSKEFVPIVYGLLDEKSMAEAKAGKIACGGCSFDLDGPHWCCKLCDHRWPREGWLPTAEEHLAYWLRWERHVRRPDVFAVLAARKIRLFFLGLIRKCLDECFRIPLLVLREKPVIEKRIALKEGGYRYLVRFRNEVVRVEPRCTNPNLLDAHCTSRKNYLAGTPESRSYQTVAMRLVFKEAPQYREAMKASERQLHRELESRLRRHRL